MKNVQVIDGAQNCAYDIFSASDADFRLLFGPGEDVAFIEDVFQRHRAGTGRLQAALSRMWKRRVAKRNAQGIHGTLFFGLQEKKAFYPTLRDEEARNPNGTPLRRKDDPLGKVARSSDSRHDQAGGSHPKAREGSRTPRRWRAQ